MSKRTLTKREQESRCPQASAGALVTLEHFSTILDTLKIREAELQGRLDREPKTKGGKPNPMVPHLRKELDAIVSARLAFRDAWQIRHGAENG